MKISICINYIDHNSCDCLGRSLRLLRLLRLLQHLIVINNATNTTTTEQIIAIFVTFSISDLMNYLAIFKLFEYLY